MIIFLGGGVSLITTFSTIYDRSKGSPYGSHFSKIIERGFGGGVGNRSTVNCRGGGDSDETSRSIIVGSYGSDIGGIHSRINKGDSADG